MKKWTVILAGLLILAGVGLSQDPSKPAWRGRVETQNGIPVVKNPADPVFGVRPLDLAEDLTLGNDSDKNLFFYRIRAVKTDRDGNIFVLDSGNFRIQAFDKNGRFIRSMGRQGQGPAEFQLPVKMELDDTTGRLFVYDVMTKSLAVFNKDGVFQRFMHVPSCRDFVTLNDDGVLAVVGTSSDAELTAQHLLCLLAPDGKIKETFTSARYNLFMQHHGEATSSISTGHELSLYLSRIDDQTLVYGYSKNYALTIIDQTGKTVRRFDTEAPKPAFTAEELQSYKRIPVPEQKPYFYALSADSVGRIYVRRVSIGGIRGRGPVDLGPVDVDVFSKDGYYLFKTILPPNTGQIRDGMIYCYTLNEGSGEERVKRLKIRNWPDLPTGIGGKQIP
ncbi:MAG: 6-bladed beta-propeller [Candidatus Aminicenantales bacterium]